MIKTAVLLKLSLPIKNIFNPAEKNLKKSNTKKSTDEKKSETKEKTLPEKETIKDVFAMIITPEERKAANLFDLNFWKNKTAEFIKVREKQKQGLTIFETLAMGAAPTREYYILTVLSCVIATMGLIQGSAAVIIGAMIVAPLMTPILAFSLGVVWGDLFLIRLSVASIFKGVFWAVFISSSIAFIVPLPILSPEIIARTSPTLFDVAVAIASGLVGAYGNANQKISNSLVGIAIAVALMPPLCTIGIGIGTGSPAVAGGAAILFMINLICISLAGAVVFWLMKIQPVTAEQSQVTRRAVSQIVASIIILSVISIPAGIFMIDGYRKEIALTDTKNTLSKEFPDMIVSNIITSGLQKNNIIEISLTGKEIPDNAKMKETINKIMNKHKIISDINVHFFKSEPVGK
ncbi:MAG: hypothetical protein CVV49_07660 [Spirochaetae bacterium HGW-Spirochaetae-5]|nr:MAG: hypothetical protein CVV49_07660 [Spirochaetae bacterium HGW-Spirochaetae-5]